jgi:hypothetical protein
MSEKAKATAKEELRLTGQYTSLHDRLHAAVVSAQVTRNLILEAIDDLDDDTDDDDERDFLRRLLETVSVTQHGLVRIADCLSTRRDEPGIGRIGVMLLSNDQD